MSSQSSHMPTDVLYEIFFRLPSARLVYKFRCVSKLWNSLLSKPSFVKKISKILASEVPWIFMYDPSDIQVQLYPNQYTDKFVKPLGLSFEFLLEKVCILDSCSNGLVLYSPYPFESHEYNNNNNTLLCICNPLTEEWISLPPRPHNDSQGIFHYCTQLVCDSTIFGNYKVVCVYTDTSVHNICFQVFSSETSKWKMFSSPGKRWRSMEFWYGFSNMVIRHGILYWTGQVRGPSHYGKILIGYSIVDNNGDFDDRFMSMNLPMKIDHASIDDDCKRVFSFFAELEGSFYCGQIEHSTADFKAFLTVYRINQDDPANGGLFHCETVHKNVELMGYRSFEIEAIYMNPVNPNVVIIVDSGSCLSYNITTLTFENLHGHPIPFRFEEEEEDDDDVDIFPKEEFHILPPISPIFIRPTTTVIPPLL